MNEEQIERIIELLTLLSYNLIEMTKIFDTIMFDVCLIFIFGSLGTVISLIIYTFLIHGGKDN